MLIVVLSVSLVVAAVYVLPSYAYSAYSKLPG